MGFEFGSSYTADGLKTDDKGILVETEVKLDKTGYVNGKGQQITAIDKEFLVPTINLITKGTSLQNKVVSATIRSELIGNGMEFTMVVVTKPPELQVYKLSGITVLTDISGVTIDRTAKTLTVDLPNYGIGATLDTINWAGGKKYAVNKVNPFDYEIKYIIGHYKGSAVGTTDGAASNFEAADLPVKTYMKGEQYEVTAENPVVKVTAVKVVMNLMDGNTPIKKEIFYENNLNIFPAENTK